MGLRVIIFEVKDVYERYLLRTNLANYGGDDIKIGGYKYTTNGSTVPSVTIDSYYNGDLSYGYPWKITVTLK